MVLAHACLVVVWTTVGGRAGSRATSRLERRCLWDEQMKGAEQEGPEGLRGTPLWNVRQQCLRRQFGRENEDWYFQRVQSLESDPGWR